MTPEGIAAERVVGYELDVDAEGGPDGSGDTTTWRVPLYLAHRPEGSDADKQWAVSVRAYPNLPLTELLVQLPHSQSTIFAGSLDDARALAVEYAAVLASALSALRERERRKDRLGLASFAVSEFVVARGGAP